MTYERVLDELKERNVAYVLSSYSLKLHYIQNVMLMNEQLLSLSLAVVVVIIMNSLSLLYSASRWLKALFIFIVRFVH